jgi:hypothetical protein
MIALSGWRFVGGRQAGEVRAECPTRIDHVTKQRNRAFLPSTVRVKMLKTNIADAAPDALRRRRQ